MRQSIRLCRVTSMTLLVGLAVLGAVGAAMAGEPSASKPPTGGEPLPAASLQRDPALVVIGIIVRDVGESVAILEDRETKKQNTYGVGSAVKGGRVSAITSDRVIIAFPDGQMELRLAAGGGALALPLPPHARTVPEPTAPSAPVSAMPPESGPMPPESSPMPQVGRAELERFVQARDAFTQVTPLEDRGVRIGEVRRDSLFQMLGLRRGDIVRDVNGQAPGPEASFGQLVQQAAAAGVIRLRVERNGKPDVKYIMVRP